MTEVNKKKEYPLDPLVKVMSKLRSPQGCPWDREQTHESLKRYLIEETYEVIEAIELGDMHRLCEELGDLLLQIVFHAQLAGERGDFDVNDIVQAIADKMERRHPHVFGDETLDTAHQVEDSWEAIKDKEKAESGNRETLMDVPRGIPALLRAEKVQSRASRVGLDWPDIRGAWSKIEEEKRELLEAVERGDEECICQEYGDLLFAVVNVGRFLQLDPEEALGQTIEKFIRRFRKMEEMSSGAGHDLENLTLAVKDKLWEEIKKLEKITEKTGFRQEF